MNPLLEIMLQYVEVYKYAAIFILTFLGAVALPLPTGTMMVAAGFLASSGHYHLTLLLTIGILGNVAGDNTGYFLAKHTGIRLVKFKGFRRFKDKLGPMERHIEKHPMLTIFWSRFFTAVAPSVNIVAGLAHIRYRTYLLFEFLGEVAEVTMFTLLGYWFGQEWERISQYSFLFLVALVGSLYLSARFWKYFTSRDNESVKAE